jgi:hypothetical protein
MKIVGVTNPRMNAIGIPDRMAGLTAMLEGDGVETVGEVKT